MEKNMNRIYQVEDIFEDIDGDSENVLMNIPIEIAEQMGWGEGTVIEITVVNETIVLKEKI
jgi:hypothetical protein